MSPTLPTKRPLNEQQVLKKLGIPDFRHLSKDKVMQFCSMIDRMDPEVAKAAIAQFPEFASTMKDILTDFQGTLKDAMAKDSESLQEYYKGCQAVIDALSKTLEKEDLDQEERRYVIDRMLEVQNQMAKAGSEHRKLIAHAIVVGAATVICTVGAAAAVLGGNTNLNLPGDDNEA